MRTILFKGNASTKKFELYNHRGVEAEVTPLIITEDAKDCWGKDEIRMGLLLECTSLTVLDGADEETSLEPFEEFNGYSAMYNPILWWRALQFLEAMPVIGEIFDLEIYLGAGRYVPDSHFQRAVGEVREAVGDRNYEAIMSRSVPKEIIDLLIRMADEGQDVSIALHDISDEIDAGTIRWSQELKRIGVKHPDYWRAYKAAKAEIVARYEPYLFSYAAHREAPYSRESEGKCMLMLSIESCIVDCVERNIEQDYGADIAVLLGILKAEVETDDILEDLENRYKKRGRDDDESRQPFTRPTPEQRFQETIAWFTQSFTEKPFSKQPVQGSHEEYEETLQRLYQRWEQMPVVSSLVS